MKVFGFILGLIGTIAASVVLTYYGIIGLGVALMAYMICDVKSPKWLFLSWLFWPITVFYIAFMGMKSVIDELTETGEESDD